MAVQRPARTRAPKLAAPKGPPKALKSEALKAARTADADGVNHETDDAETLTDRAYRLVEELIVTLALPPETILSEQSLAARLKIGRTPIREALQRLARCWELRSPVTSTAALPIRRN